MGKQLQGDELLARANELGISHHRLYSGYGGANEAELQRRVREAEAHRRAEEGEKRERRMWILTVISTLAGIVSACAAAFALLLAR